MIENDEQLAVEQKALGHIERALDSLRAEFEGKSMRNFPLYSEPYVEQIEILKAQIDEYLARKKTKPPERNAAPAPTENPSANVP